MTSVCVTPYTSYFSFCLSGLACLYRHTDFAIRSIWSYIQAYSQPLTLEGTVERLCCEQYKGCKGGVEQAGQESEDETSVWHWKILGYRFNKILKMCNSSQRSILKIDY